METRENQIRGLRVAIPSGQVEDGIGRGTVLSIDDIESSIDDYRFVIRLDHSAQQQLWPLKRFYGKYERIVCTC
jgi:hypothetical protein